MSSEPPPNVNRRTDERHLTLFRVGTILLGDDRELCLVKNISAGGASVRIYCKLKAKQALKIELKDGQPVAGHVSWIRGMDAGIEFDEPVDVIELLKGSENGPRPRMPRIEASGLCWIRKGAILHRSEIQNISQGGVSVESDSDLAVGAEVTVRLPGLDTQGGAIRWKSANRYGIAFNTVLPLATLVDWLHSRNAG